MLPRGSAFGLIGNTRPDALGRRRRPLRLDALPALWAQRPEAAGDLARPVAQLRRRPAVRHASARSCAGRSTSASPTSTWPTTTARRTARPRRTSAGSSREDFARLPRRAGHLHQGRLRHVAGAVRRVGLAQVPARQPRPVAGADGPGLRRHLLLATAPTPTRRWRRRWARWTPRCARARRCTRASRPTRRSRPREAAAILRGPGHAAAHPPAVVLDAQPLDRGRSLLDALERGGRRLHRLLAAGPGHAHRPLPRRHPGRTRGRAPGQVAVAES